MQTSPAALAAATPVPEPLSPATGDTLHVDPPPPTVVVPGKSVLPRPVTVHDGSASLAALQSLSSIIVVAVFIVTFSLQPFRIPSASMEPTLLVGDFLLVDKQDKGEPSSHNWLSPFPGSAIHRGDVVVFYYPVDPSLHLVKRVIGLPGDRLRMRGGRVYINGKELDEPYAVYTRSHGDSFRDNFPHLTSTDPDVDSRWWMQLHHLVENGELKIPPDRYFVLGDNRNDSEDSRYWGLVPADSVVGEPLLVYFSLRDSAEQPALPGDAISQSMQTQRQHRTLGEALVDLARWDRTLHVIH